jgi:hypothetical protein
VTFVQTYGVAEKAAGKQQQAFPQGLKPRGSPAVNVGAKAPTPYGKKTFSASCEAMP